MMRLINLIYKTLNHFKNNYKFFLYQLICPKNLNFLQLGYHQRLMVAI